MSETDGNSNLGPSTQVERVVAEAPYAEARKGRWPGWIWSIPIAAVAIVAWLAFRQLTAEGALITVVFPQADGISAGQTTVIYHGLTVGKVESVHLEKDLSRVRAEIRIVPELEGHLGEGTEFWIETPGLTDLTSLRSIISGPSIGIAPVLGHRQKMYEGLARAPVTPQSERGTRYILHATNLGTVARGSKVYFHGLEVGDVEDVRLEPDHIFRIRIFVEYPYDRLVHENTRFWNAGAVQISLRGVGPRLQMQSLPALLSGAVDFETLGEQGAIAPGGSRFALYDNQEDAAFAPGPRAIAYRTVFGLSAGEIQAGAAVTLAGIRVGTVEKTALHYDKMDGALSEHVLFAIEPSRLGLPRHLTDPRSEVDALMRRLIARGLRAEPGSSIPLLGAQTVALNFVTAHGPATLLPGHPPEFPSTEGGSGIGGVIDAVSALTAEVERLPLAAIARNVQTLTANAASLSSSARLQKSLGDLEGTVANLEAVSASAKTDIPAVLAELHKVAREADGTVASARLLVTSAAGTGPEGLNTASVGQTLYQINRAAEAIRELVTYLDRHPSALIRGRQ